MKRIYFWPKNFNSPPEASSLKVFEADTLPQKMMTPCERAEKVSLKIVTFLEYHFV